MQTNQTVSRQVGLPLSCECCDRDREERRGTLQFVEEKAWLCEDCTVMYHDLWRVARSPVVPNVILFQIEVKNDIWRPASILKELAANARENHSEKLSFYKKMGIGFGCHTCPSCGSESVSIMSAQGPMRSGWGKVFIHEHRCRRCGHSYSHEEGAE